MFTMKFEIDPRSTDGGKTHQVIACDRYRVNELTDTTEVTMGFKDSTESPYVIGGGIEHYQRCYVMNEAGATVDTIRSPHLRVSNIA